MTANDGGAGGTTAEHTERRGRIPADTFAVRLLLARHLAGMGIKEAAEAAGLHYATWSTWEAGRRPRDLVDVCQRVAAALDIDFNWLLLGGPLLGPRGRRIESSAERSKSNRVSCNAEHVRPVSPRPPKSTVSVRPSGPRAEVRSDQRTQMPRAIAGRRPVRVDSVRSVVALNAR